MPRILSLVAGVVGIVAVGWVPAGNGFKGTVRDMDFKPVAGAWIEARSVARATLDASDFEGEPAHATRSAADGSYSLTGLGPGLWIVTAVASTTPRTDDEMKDLARAGAQGPVPAGVAVTRLVRRYAEESLWSERVDIGLAPSAASSIHGRLVGDYDHEHFFYAIEYDHSRVTHLSPGTHTITFTGTGTTDGDVSNSSDFATPTLFSAVPTADGRFDFGSLALDEQASIVVKAAPLASNWPTSGADAFAFCGPIAKLEHGEDGLQVPVSAQRSVTFRASCDPAKLPASRPEVHVWDESQLQFIVWDEHGIRRTLWEGNDGADTGTVRQLLSTGKYLVRATHGSLASVLIPLRVDAAGEMPDVVCELVPGSRISLVDEAGEPIPDAWIFIGTEATADFADPFPLFSVTDEAGALTSLSLAAGQYRAQLVHEKGSYEEWRVDFEIDAKGPQQTVAVPLSKKVRTYK